MQQTGQCVQQTRVCVQAFFLINQCVFTVCRHFFSSQEKQHVVFFKLHPVLKMVKTLHTLHTFRYRRVKVFVNQALACVCLQQTCLHTCLHTNRNRCTHCTHACVSGSRATGHEHTTVVHWHMTCVACKQQLTTVC